MKQLYRKSLIIIIILFANTSIIFGQASYNQTISYNQDGHSGTVSFKCEFNHYMGEPIRKAVAKLQSSNDDCKPSTLNVTIDIYQGSFFVASYTFTNLISMDIAGSPSWGEVFPGVSVEKAKEYYKAGITIRNARLTDINFPSGCGGNNSGSEESSSVNSSAEKQKKEEEAKVKKEEEAQQQNKIEQEEQAKNERVQREQDARQMEIERQQAIRQQKQQAAAAEQARREKNQQAKRDYDRKIAEQENRNVEQAGAMAAASMSSLMLIGMVMYQDMGKIKAKYTYVGNQIYMGLNIGYSITSFPIVFNSKIITLSYNSNTGDNNYITKTQDEPSRATPLNINIRPFMGYESEFGGGEIYGSFQPGTNLFFDGFNTSTEFGGNIFGGVSWVKAYYNLNFSTRRYYKIDWIDPEEVGEGLSKFKYRSSTVGMRFSFESSGRSYARHHIILGRIYENITEGLGTDDGDFLAYYRNLDIEKINRPNAYYRIKGYLLEWNKEHNFRVYFKYYPNYPISGLKMYRQSGLRGGDKDYTFFEFGFIRQIKAFY